MGVGQEDPSQVVALASVWILLLIFGSAAIMLPVIYGVGRAFNDAIHSRYFFPSGRSPFDMIEMLNVVLFIGLGCLVGYPVASASGKIFSSIHTDRKFNALLHVWETTCSVENY